MSNAGQADYVALSSGEFRAAYDTFSAAIAGKLPFDPTFPASSPDTPFNRALHAANRLFSDEAKRISCDARIHRVIPIAFDRKYAKYIDRQTGWFHIALMTAAAAVPFSSRTTPKTLRAGFDAEFRRRLASMVDGAGRESSARDL